MEWEIGKYGTDRIQIGSFLTISVSYDSMCSKDDAEKRSKPYVYHINGGKGKTRFADGAECKKFALNQARLRWEEVGRQMGWLTDPSKEEKQA